MSQYDFCFCTVASRNYIVHAAGLWNNIREIHSSTPLVVLSLDDDTHEIFSGREEEGLISVPAEEAWGREYWHNIRMRSNVPESAYASKAALIHWILESGLAASTILLDCDVVLLAPLHDLIEQCRNHDVLLVPTRHDLASWRRSQRAGLFSAGVVGISEQATYFAAGWKAMCFEQCMVLPIDGIYNEQKYLEYLIGNADTVIVRDPGVNVSATIFNVVRPEKDEEGVWRSADGKAIRMFHVSRTTDSEFELSRMKMDHDHRALEKLDGERYLPREDVAVPRERDGKRSGITLGRLFELAQGTTVRMFRRVMFMQRMLKSREGSLMERFRGTFEGRKKLTAALWDKANRGR